MLKIIRAGMYTTMPGMAVVTVFRQSGISHCGALDMPALRIANLLVGNDNQCPRTGDHARSVNGRVRN